MIDLTAVIDFADFLQAQAPGPSTPGEVLDWVQFRAGTWAATIQQAMVGWAVRALAVVIALMLVWYGYQIMFGWARGTIDDVAGKFAAIILIIVFTVSSIIWWPALYTFFTEVPKELAVLTLAATGAGSDAAAILDRVFEKGINAGITIIAQSGYLNPTGTIVGVIVLAATFFFAGLMFALIGMSYIMLALLLGLAPVMVIALAFKTTRTMFEKWLGMLINYALIPVLTYTIGTLIMVGADGAMLGVGGDEITLRMMIPYLIWCVLGFGVLAQVPSVAASLGGGVAMTGAGAIAGLGAQAVSAVARTGARGAGAVARGVGKGGWEVTGMRQRVDTWRASRGERTRRAAVERVNAEEKAKSGK